MRVQSLRLNAATEVLHNRPLMSLMLGHFTVDMYVGLLPMLYPLLVAQFDLDFGRVGLVTLAYSGAASLAQPLFGWLADRFGTRFIGLALVWSTTLFALLGFVPSFELLIALAAVAGLGSAMYHPFGAVNASQVMHESNRNTAMSIYVTGGTLGVAVGPIVGAAIFAAGMQGTALMFIPGLLIAGWLLYELRTVPPSQMTVTAAPADEPAAPLPVRALVVVVLVMMLRIWTVYSIFAFIPTWYASLGYEPSFYGALSATVLLSAAVGTIFIGMLADRIGRRNMIIAASILTIPGLLLLTVLIGPPAFIAAILFGITADSTAPLLLLMAQQLMARRAGMASGLILGLGFVAGAIGVPITGAIADQIGFVGAIRLQVVLVVITIALSFFLPERRARTASTPTTQPQNI